jgi:hypothetical protein
MFGTRIARVGAARWTGPLAVGLAVIVFASRPGAGGGETPRAAAHGPADRSRLLDEALRAEVGLELGRATALYGELLQGGGQPVEPAPSLQAQQGLRRVASLKAGFALTEAEMDRRLAQTFAGYRPQELPEWERRGWLYARVVDGSKRYHVSNATNLAFFDASLRRRNPHLAEGDRFFARVFLEAAAELDARRRQPGPPERYVLPQTYVYAVQAVIHQQDLPAGPVVRAWFPSPLLTPGAQKIRVVDVQPAGSLRQAPDVESTIGIAYLEAPRPPKGDLTLAIELAFEARHTDFNVDPERVPPYDVQSEVYRRFTRSEPQIELNAATRELARSIVGGEQNPYRKARRLYDWVCEHCTYNYVWQQRDTTFAGGCASDEVRRRRIGDCVIQSMFYAALCRSVGIPARVVSGPVFPPCFKNDHVWAEVLIPGSGWMPVDVTYSEVIAMAPDLSQPQRRQLRDFFFGRVDRWRFCSQRNDLSQPLLPAKQSPRVRTTMFTHPEFECGGRDVEKAAVTWECRPQTSYPAAAAGKAIYGCAFTAGGWRRADWIPAGNPRMDFGRWVQEDGRIANAVPPSATPKELRGKFAPQTYASMVYREKLTGDMTITSTMDFAERMAPLIVLAPDLADSAGGQKQLGERFEVVIFDEGVNIWRHMLKDGKLAYRLASFARFPLQSETRYTLEVKKSGKTLTVSVAGHTFGYSDEALPDAFYAGITGCEGLNHFYDFGLRRAARK